MPRHPLRILTGPTAAGKTSLALDWAKRSGGWILSCDALLFYRGADTGTAKPTPAERTAVPHFGIDLCEPSEVFSLPSYIAHARQVLDRADEADVPILVVGGSSFYLAAFHEPAPDPIPVPPETKEQVRRIAQTGGAEALAKALRAIDPAPVVDLSNPRRTAPALERCLATGLSTLALKKRRENLPCPFEDRARIWFRTDPGDASLCERIHRRTRTMLTNGLIDEVRRLRNAGFERNPTLSRAIGYRETLEHLDGRLPAAELAHAIDTNTLRLARRQRKWIRNRLPPARDAADLGHDHA